MILLVSGATKYPRGADVGHLIVPRQWNLADSLELQPCRWAMDNGAFSGFDEGAYVRMLERFAHVRGCLFAAADGFAALRALHAYDLPVDTVSIVWNIKHGLPYEKLWRVTFSRTMEDRADETPMFVVGCRAVDGGRSAVPETADPSNAKGRDPQ